MSQSDTNFDLPPSANTRTQKQGAFFILESPERPVITVKTITDSMSVSDRPQSDVYPCASRDVDARQPKDFRPDSRPTYGTYSDVFSRPQVTTVLHDIQVTSPPLFDGT